MMGEQQAQKERFSYVVDLDQRVRKSNPLRKIHESIDFTFFGLPMPSAATMLKR